MVRFLKCSMCPYDEKEYNIPDFTEHYAQCHIGDFYLYSCPYCQTRFASSFLAAHHMLTCWDSSTGVQEYARPIDEIPFGNYQLLNNALETAVNEAIDRAVEKEKHDHTSKSDTSEAHMSQSDVYPSNYGFYSAPYGDSDRLRDNKCTSLNTMFNNNHSTPNSSWGDSTRSPNRHVSLQEYGYQRQNRQNSSMSPREVRDRRDRRGRSRSPPRRRVGSPPRRRVDRRENDTNRRRERGMSPDFRTSRRMRRSPAPHSFPSRSNQSFNASSSVSSTNIDDRKKLPGLFDDLSAHLRNPITVALPPTYKPPIIMQIGRGVPKLTTGFMNTKGMEIFNAKNGTTDLNIEIQSSKGSTQMFFNQERLGKASTYFAKIFASPEFRESAEKKLSLHRPEVPFIDAMNYLHTSRVPWKTRCRGGYFIVDNLHRAYKVLQEAKDLEMQIVKDLAAKDLFLNRCNLANDVIDCTGCIERVVLALHFEIPVPEKIKFTPVACVKWRTDCEERSCAPELDASLKTIQFLDHFLPSGILPGVV